MIMSARRLLALLVVVLLGLLLASPSALSRPELPRCDVSHGGGPVFADGDDDDGNDDPGVPNGNVGDDDNWDKQAAGRHVEASPLDGSVGAGEVVPGTSSSEVELSRMEIGLSMRLALFLQSWLFISGLH
jgi:hypothetical protein